MWGVWGERFLPHPPTPPTPPTPPHAQCPMPHPHYLSIFPVLLHRIFIRKLVTTLIPKMVCSGK
nr:hypothetical protein [Nostoc sp. ChiSLP01]